MIIYISVLLVFLVGAGVLLKLLLNRPIGKELREYRLSWPSFAWLILFWIWLAGFGFLLKNSQLLLGVDKDFLSLIFGLRNTSLTPVMVFITNIFETSTVALVLWGVWAWLVIKKKYYSVWTWVLAVFGSTGAVWVLKHLIARARPDEMGRLISEDGFSYFSGHSSIVAVVAIVSIYFLLKNFNWTGWKKYTAVALGVMLMLFVGFSRLYLGVHYVSDVLVGFLGGSFWALLAIRDNQGK